MELLVKQKKWLNEKRSVKQKNTWLNRKTQLNR